jgi:hypothetical protein
MIRMDVQMINALQKENAHTLQFRIARHVYLLLNVTITIHALMMDA